MNKAKTKILTHIVAILISIIGCLLIGDVKIITGVIFIVWGNNFNYQRKKDITDLN